MSNVVSLLAELSRAGLEAGDTERVINHLHRELLEAQELANTGKQKCLELQGNLDLLLSCDFIYIICRKVLELKRLIPFCSSAGGGEEE